MSGTVCRKVLALGGGLLMLLMSAWTVAAQPTGEQALRHTLVVDRSGSMAGFFNAGSITALVDELKESLPDGAAVTPFYSIERDLVPMATGAGYGRMTLLDQALKAVRLREARARSSADVIWLVTDNIQDDAGSPDERADVQAFYDGLAADSALGRIYIFPQPMPFDGKLYAKGANVLSPRYVGDRGLVVYALLRNPAAEASFERITATLAARFRRRFKGGGERLLTKPLGDGTIHFAPFPSQPMTLRSADGTQRTTNVVAGPNRRLVVPRALPWGEPIRLSFPIRFESQLPHVSITPAAPLRVELPVGAVSHNFTVSPGVVKVTPDRLKLDASGTSETFLVEIALAPPALPGKSFWSALWDSAGLIGLKASFTARVPRGNFQLTPELLNRYAVGDEIFTNPSPSVQRRVHRLGGLVQRMSGDTVTITTASVPIVVPVEYPLWPWLVVLGVLALLAAAGFFFYKLHRGPSYRISHGSSIRTFQFAPGRRQPIPWSGVPMAEAVRDGWGDGIRLVGLDGATLDGAPDLRMSGGQRTVRLDSRDRLTDPLIVTIHRQ